MHRITAAASFKDDLMVDSVDLIDLIIAAKRNLIFMLQKSIFTKRLPLASWHNTLSRN